MVGDSSDETDTRSNPISRNRSATARSYAGLRSPWTRATAAVRWPARTSRRPSLARDSRSRGSISRPRASSRPHTSTTAPARLAGFRTRSANSSGRAWVPISSRSPKPRVTNSTGRSPERVSRALVPRVVPSRMDMGGSGSPDGVPVITRVASRGAGSGERTSNAAPTGRSSGRGGSSSSTAGSARWERTRCGAPARSSSRKSKPVARPSTPAQGASTCARAPPPATTCPRSDEELSTLIRHSPPPGSTARQSVNVPPVSTNTRHRLSALPPVVAMAPRIPSLAREHERFGSRRQRLLPGARAGRGTVRDPRGRPDRTAGLIPGAVPATVSM